MDNGFPAGWDEERVRRVIAHYENQGEDEAVAEDEAAREHDDTVVVEIPAELLPAVREMIGEYEATHPSHGNGKPTRGTSA